MRVLLADDKGAVRFALRALLEQQPGIEVAGEAFDAETLVAQARLAGADLILLDWDLAGADGADLLAALRAARPAVQVIALSGRQEVREAAFAAGAHAFVSKAEPPGHLLHAIATCARRREEIDRRDWLRRSGLFMLLLACGLAVFLLGCNYYEVFPTNRNAAYEGSLALAFLIAAARMKSHARWNKYWEVAYAFFIASAVWFITTLVSTSSIALRLVNVSASTPAGVAIAKAGEVAGTVTIILVLNRLGGAGLGSVFIRRGNLKWALIGGVAVLLNFATAALMAMGTLGKLMTLDALGALLLWGLVFSLANGFMEELWFRGIFLGKLQPLIGQVAAIALTALLFSSMHAGATYASPAAIPIFLVNLFTHGLVMGYLVFKLQNLWGASLYHAACDLWLFVMTAAFAGSM